MSQPQMAVLRIARYKNMGHATMAMRHNTRDMAEGQSLPSWINSDLSGHNEVLIGPHCAGDLAKDAEKVIAKATRVRRDSVRLIEYVVTGSKATMHKMWEAGTDGAYLKASLEWIKNRHGPETVVSAVIHRDEETPHLHVMVVPLKFRETGKARGLWLSSDHFFGSPTKLSLMQTDFAKTVSQKYGLERGLEGSKQIHKTVKEYHRERAATWDDLQSQIPEISVEVPPPLANREKWAKEQSEKINSLIEKAFRPLLGKIRTMLDQFDENKRAQIHFEEELKQGQRCKALIKEFKSMLESGKKLNPEKFLPAFNWALTGIKPKTSEQQAEILPKRHDRGRYR